MVSPSPRRGRAHVRSPSQPSCTPTAAALVGAEARGGHKWIPGRDQLVTRGRGRGGVPGGRAGGRLVGAAGGAGRVGGAAASGVAGRLDGGRAGGQRRQRVLRAKTARGVSARPQSTNKPASLALVCRTGRRLNAQTMHVQIHCRSILTLNAVPCRAQALQVQVRAQPCEHQERAAHLVRGRLGGPLGRLVG